MFLNSDIVDDVRDAIAASVSARHRDTMLNLDRMTSEGISWSPSLQTTVESKSSIGLAYSMVVCMSWVASGQGEILYMKTVPSWKFKLRPDLALSVPIWTHPT